MRFYLQFAYLLMTVPFASPIATLTIIEVTSQIINLVQDLLATWSNINTQIDLFKSNENAEEELLSNLHNINQGMAGINAKLDTIGDDISMITKMLNNLPETIRLELNLKDLHTQITQIDIYYTLLEEYLADFKNYTNSTLIDFANNVVSPSPCSVRYIMRHIYQEVVQRSFLDLVYKHFQSAAGSYFCKERKSLQQVFHDLLIEMVVTNLKSHIAVQTAYMIKRLYGQGHFKKEVSDSNREFQQVTNTLINGMGSYMSRASSELWRCNPEVHREGETYIQITNFLHGYVLNEKNLNPKSCSKECRNYNNYLITQSSCGNDGWCNKQSPCHKVLNCQEIASEINVCAEKTGEQHRRYSYIEFKNGTTFGKKKTCDDVTSLKSSVVWFKKCSYCVCICEEPSNISNRHINLRWIEANVTDNRVVTGLRFVKHNNIIHIQIQEGKLLPYGQIDLDSVRWVPPDNYKTTDDGVNELHDYFTIHWERRSFDLSDIKALNGTIVTGIKFQRFNDEIRLQILTIPFNFTTGRLEIEFDIHHVNNHGNRSELKLINPDIPTLSHSQSMEITTNKYIKFIHTDFEKDAAQTTVPFFDAQDVVPAVPIPLSGVGMFHKGKAGFGGFIAPKIFTYNFSQHLKPVNFKKKTDDDDDNNKNKLGHYKKN